MKTFLTSAVAAASVAAGAWVATAAILPSDAGADGPPEVVGIEHLFDLQHEYRLLLPAGHLDLDVSPPSAKIQVEPVDDDLGQNVDAGHGKSLIAVGWSYLPSESGLPSWDGDAESPDIALTLVDGDLRIPMGDVRTAYSSSPAQQTGAYTTVDGAGTGLRLEAEFDGVVQSIDLDSGQVDAGAAGVLDDRGPWYVPADGCSELTPEDSPVVPSRESCHLDPVRLAAWLPGKGWAPAGSSWAVARVLTQEFAVSIEAGGLHYGEYAPTREDLDVRLDGVEPVDSEVTHQATESTLSTTARFVWHVDAAPQELTVERTLHLVTSKPFSGTKPPPNPGTLSFRSKVALQPA